MNDAKFRELVLYIAQASADDPRFGAIKLNKILYYSDFAVYRRLGHSLTDDEYQHLSEGPAPRHLLPIRSRLIKDGAAHIEDRPYFNAMQQRLVADESADLSQFDSQELAIVDEILRALREYNGAEVSDLSHHEFGWALTHEGETIPYEAAWVASDLEPLTVEQIARGVEVAREHGLAITPGAELLIS